MAVVLICDVIDCHKWCGYLVIRCWCWCWVAIVSGGWKQNWLHRIKCSSSWRKSKYVTCELTISLVHWFTLLRHRDHLSGNFREFDSCPQGVRKLTKSQKSVGVKPCHGKPFFIFFIFWTAPVCMCVNYIINCNIGNCSLSRSATESGYCLYIVCRMVTVISTTGLHWLISL